MYVNRSHPCLSTGPKPPGYDLELEILIILPLASAAHVEILANDFGGTHAEIRAIVHWLADNYGVEVGINGVRVPKDPRLLAAMIEATERYYDQVHKP